MKELVAHTTIKAGLIINQSHSIKDNVMKNHIVYWKSLLTGYEGHGEPLTKQNAEAAVERGNKEFAGIINHWIEVI